MLIPLSTLDEALTIFHDEFDIYPLWLCPFYLSPPKSENLQPFVASQSNDCLFVDVGAYGTPKSKSFHHIRSLRRVESFVRKVKGYQALYADTLMTREEFKDMFNHTGYEKMRKKWNAEDSLPEVYEKICRAARR